MKFVGDVAADGAGVGLHRTEIHAQSGKDAGVGSVHELVGFLQRRLVGMEGIGVLHQELARAHDAEARTYFVAELGLYLVIVHRQLLVAAQFTSGDIGDDLLVGGAETEIALVTVLEAQQLGSVLFPAPGFLPELRRLDRRHQQFKRTRPVHFLANDGLDLAQYAQAERQPAVNAGGLFADHAGTQHQLVADDFGIGRCFFQGG